MKVRSTVRTKIILLALACFLVVPQAFAGTSGQTPEVKEALPAPAADSKVQPAQPKVKQFPSIEFVEKDFTFKKVLDGDLVTHQFKFKNTGVGDLEIKQVKTG